MSAEEPLVLRRGIGKPTTCRSCGAAIVFAATTTKKAAPFEQDKKGMYTLENGVATFIGSAPSQLELGQAEPRLRYTSHFATCPKASEWRRNGRG